MKVVSQDPAVQAAYERIVANGTHPRMAEILAHRKAPGVVTDTNGYGHSRQTIAKRFGGDPDYMRQLIAGAKAHGYTPSENDAYNETLARFTGDPEAFVPNGSGEGHVKKIIEKRGLLRQSEVDPKEQAPALADDLAKTYAKRLVAANPKATEADLVAEAKKQFGDKRSKSR